MKFILAFVMMVFVTSSGLCAKTKSKTFTAPPDRVFAALLSVIEAHHAITVVDKTKYLVSFTTGMSAMSNGSNCTAALDTSDPAKTTLTIHTQLKTDGKGITWESGGKIADNIFKWMDEELVKQAAASTKN